MRSMPDICRAELGLLGFFAERGEFHRMTESLQNPFPAGGKTFFGSAEKEFAQSASKIKKCMPGLSGIRELFELYLITQCLLFKEHAPQWAIEWVQEEIEIDRYLPGVSFDRCLSAVWKAAPVLLTSGEAVLRYFIIGKLPGTDRSDLLPNWTEGLLDEDSKAAIQTAARLAGRFSQATSPGCFCCYPLIPVNRSGRIEGASLGLPLALTFISAALNHPLHPCIASSGTLTDEGGIREVGHLEEKSACAQENGFRAFMYPASNQKPSASSEMELLPVADLSEAVLFGKLYAPSNGRSLLLLAETFKNPKALINNLDGIDPQWIASMHREGKWRNCVEGISRSEDLFPAYVQKLGRLIKEWRLDAARAVSELIPLEMIDRAAKISPLSAFNLCTHNMAFSNHRGDVAGAENWAEAGDRLFKTAMKADLDACADYLNNKFVTLHNRFEFRVDFPEKLRIILSPLEARRQAQCAAGCLTDRALAELYGSIAQNFGFCGPKHLDRCEAFVEKAVAAFGGGEVPELRKDLLRQHGYRVYAYLDAGCPEPALKSLFQYLQVDHWDGLFKRLEQGELTIWHHAATARFLADMAPSGESRTYFNWAVQNPGDPGETDHPAQLLTFNLGRIANNLRKRDEAERLFLSSLKLCFSQKSGPTIKVMALMPLAGLWRIGSPPDDWEDIVAQSKREAIELNSKHFRRLKDKSPAEICRTVRTETGSLFPFSYR